MKKYLKIFLLFALIIAFTTVVFADEENEVTTEEEQDIVVEENYQESTTTVVNTIANVMEAGEVVEEVSGTYVEKTQKVKLEVIKGDYIGDEFTIDYYINYDVDGNVEFHELKAGDHVVVQLIEDADGNMNAVIQDVVRHNYIIGLFILFLISILIVGGKRGFRNAIAIVYTIFILYFVLVKGIYAGKSIMLTTSISSLLIIFGSFFIIGGVNKKMITASVSTLVGILIAGIIALIFNNLSKLSGMSVYIDDLPLADGAVKFDFKDILFVQVIIASIGACMDMALNLVKKLNEEKKVNPDITWKELLKVGLEYGRELASTMTNTLILAYFGVAIGSMALFLSSGMTVVELLNKELVVETFIAGLSGTIGVIYTIPCTALLFALINKDRIAYRKESINKLNGKRSLKL